MKVEIRDNKVKLEEYLDFLREISPRTSTNELRRYTDNIDNKMVYLFASMERVKEGLLRTRKFELSSDDEVLFHLETPTAVGLHQYQDPEFSGISIHPGYVYFLKEGTKKPDPNRPNEEKERESKDCLLKTLVDLLEFGKQEGIKLYTQGAVPSEDGQLHHVHAEFDPAQ